MPKLLGGFWLVIDLHFVNHFFEFPVLKFENLGVLCYSPRACTHAILIDISDAYHHLEIASPLQQYFQFMVDGELFVCHGLPFGWALAPGVFTEFARNLLEAVRNPA